MGKDNIDVTLNLKFLYKLRPERSLLIALIFSGAMFLIAPVTFRNTLTFPSVSYLVLCILAFFLGTALIKSRKPRSNVTITLSRRRLQRIYDIFLLVGIIGIVFRYIDLFFVRGLSVSYTTIENVELAGETSGNIFSVLASMTSYFIYVPFTLNMVCKGLHRRRENIFSGIVILFLAINFFISGSRFAAVFPLMYIVIILLYARKIRIKFSFKTVLIGAVALVGFVYIVSAPFLRRLEDMNIPAQAVLDASGYSHKVPASESFQKILRQNEGRWTYPFLFAYANATQYATHALLEFPEVMEYVDEKGDHFYGSATFYVVVKFFTKITGSSYDVMQDIMRHNARNGIWSTFFFMWYLDFGWFGIIMMFLFGYLAKKAWALIFYRCNILYIPLLSFLTIALYLILQLNYLAGSGTYALFVFLVLPWFFKVRPMRYADFGIAIPQTMDSSAIPENGNGELSGQETDEE